MAKVSGERDGPAPRKFRNAPPLRNRWLDLARAMRHISNKTIREAPMGIGNYLLRAATWWNSQTWATQFYTWRKGERVGEDDAGNVYYQTDGGKKRWVIYNGDAEASRVGPEWHGWLHHTWDEPPTERPLARKAWEKPHLENLTGTAAAYAPPGSIRQPKPAERRDYEAWQPE